LNILQRLNHHFGLAEGAEIELNQEEQQIYNSMLSQLLEPTELPIEKYTTLDIDLHPMDEEEEEEGKDKDDFGDDEEEEAEEESPESQPTTSGSEYIPSPVKQAAKRPDDEYLGKACMYWNKCDPKEKPRLLDENKYHRRKIESVQSKYPRIRNREMLYRYEERVLGECKRSLINREVYKIFLEKRNSGAIIHERHLRIWALQVKNKLDKHGNFLFKASLSWVTGFKKRHNIVSRKITQTQTKVQVADEKETKIKAIQFASETNKMIQGSFEDHQVFNIDQCKFEKEIHTSRTLETKGTSNVTAKVGSTTATLIVT